VRPVKSLREARAEVLAPLLRGRVHPLHAGTYDALRRRCGLSRKEVQEAIDDLIADGRASVSIENGRIVVRGTR